jgi:hypothetical protein
VLVFRVVLALALGGWALVRFGCVPGVPRTVYLPFDEAVERAQLERAVLAVARLPDGSVYVKTGGAATCGPLDARRTECALRVGERLSGPLDHHAWSTWTVARVADTEVEFAVEQGFDERSFGVNSVRVSQGTVHLPCAALAPGPWWCDAQAAMTARALDDLGACTQDGDCVSVEANACRQAWVGRAQEAAAIEQLQQLARACPGDSRGCGARTPRPATCRRGRCGPPSSPDY